MKGCHRPFYIPSWNCIDKASKIIDNQKSPKSYYQSFSHLLQAVAIIHIRLFIIIRLNKHNLFHLKLYFYLAKNMTSFSRYLVP